MIPLWSLKSTCVPYFDFENTEPFRNYNLASGFTREVINRTSVEAVSHQRHLKLLAGLNDEISSTFQFLIFSLIPVLNKSSDSRRNHALIRCLDRIISTNWLEVGELCPLTS